MNREQFGAVMGMPARVVTAEDALAFGGLPALTPEQRRRYLLAPITRGILAQTTYCGMCSGAGDGTRVPIANPRTGIISGHAIISAPRVQ